MKYLHTNPEIMGGLLVIKGTRIPIDAILYHLKDSYTVDQIHEMWSYVPIDTLKGAIQEALELAIDVINKDHAKGVLQA